LEYEKSATSTRTIILALQPDPAFVSEMLIGDFYVAILL
jgi:hypothetical protein